MRYGLVPVADALGHRLAHGLELGGHRLKKGIAITAAIQAQLAAAGVAEVVTVALEAGDVPEEVAAERLAAPLAGPGLSLHPAPGGRINVRAEADGVLAVDRAAVDRLNAVHESLTLATLAAYARVTAGQMVATAKVIPFAVAGADLARAEAVMAAAGPLLRLYPLKRDLQVVLIQTTLPTLAERVLDKTERVQAERLAALGQSLAGSHRTAHSPQALAPALSQAMAAGADLVLVLGASAICDRGDVIPSAITAAGGRVHHFGMPVDPGNLILLGDLPGPRGRRPVLGLPGCARALALNGLDWVLERLVAGVPVTAADIMAMGVGGLLKDSPARGVARVEAARDAGPTRFAGILLAAGRGTRMGAQPKLTLPLADGRPLVRAAAEALCAVPLRQRLVVLGAHGDRVAQALSGLPLESVVNPAPERGQASSLALALEAVPPEIDAVLVALGDMPLVQPATLRRLLAAFDPEARRALVHPTFQGQRGNPVVIGRRFFDALMALSGDQGARPLLAAYPEFVAAVPVDDPGVLQDVDDPAAYQAVLAAPPAPVAAVAAADGLRDTG